MPFIILVSLLFALFSVRLEAAGPQFAGCPLLPSDDIWNAPVEKVAVDANSAVYVNTIGPSLPLHPDFGAGLYNGGPIGIPFVIVPGTQPKVPITFMYADESDPGPYLIPPNPPIEGGPNSTGDRHVLVVDKDNCILYEVYYAYPQNDGSWTGGSGAIFNLRSNALRPATWTSADAAGLPMLPGLVTYDEVASGEILHAIRFTAPQTRRAFIWPGRHYASSLTDPKYPAMGQRFRLKSTVDISRFSPQSRVVARALQRFGMILADNGSAWFISGAPDNRWDNNQLNELKTLHGSDFEAVDVSPLMVNVNSGQASFTQNIRPRPPRSVVSAASLAPGPIAPGEIVSLFGSGAGPAVGVVAGFTASGKLPTEMERVRVLFDGVPAPLLYISQDQINVVTPYSLAGKTSTSIQVEFEGNLSDAQSVGVQVSAPGIFAGANGQAAALNQDGTVNLAANPAKRGSVITLYATGHGQTDPGGQDGVMSVPPLSRPVLPVKVRIGGVDASVAYAGAAPGMVSGVLQVNVQVPLSAASGSTVPVSLQVGETVSPPGVTIALE